MIARNLALLTLLFNYSFFIKRNAGAQSLKNPPTIQSPTNQWDTGKAVASTNVEMMGTGNLPIQLNGGKFLIGRSSNMIAPFHMKNKVNLSIVWL